MPKTSREPANQSASTGKAPRAHVAQSHAQATHLKNPAGAGREPVNQSRVRG
jgi:hypothetical protein